MELRLAVNAGSVLEDDDQQGLAHFVEHMEFEGTRHFPGQSIQDFLSSLAIRLNVSASTQNQALAAIGFLYREVLRIELPESINAVRAKKPARVPLVLTRAETQQVIEGMTGVYQLMAKLLYGSGLRLMECVRLRVKDIDFSSRLIRLAESKGRKARSVPIPKGLIEPLKVHLAEVKRTWERDLADGFGAVMMPDALDRKYPSAPKEWGWQWVFPATRMYVDRETGQRRRHHLHETVLQRAVHTATTATGPPSSGGTCEGSCPGRIPSSSTRMPSTSWTPRRNSRETSGTISTTA